MVDSMCHLRGFLFAPVDLMRGARVLFKIIAVVLAIIFGCATLGEIALFFFNWIFYGVLAGLITWLIYFHKEVSLREVCQKGQNDRGNILIICQVLYHGFYWNSLGDYEWEGRRWVQEAIVLAVNFDSHHNLFSFSVHSPMVLVVDGFRLFYNFFRMARKDIQKMCSKKQARQPYGRPGIDVFNSTLGTE